jgi:hypothetical protein
MIPAARNHSDAPWVRLLWSKGPGPRRAGVRRFPGSPACRVPRAGVRRFPGRPQLPRPSRGPLPSLSLSPSPASAQAQAVPGPRPPPRPRDGTRRISGTARTARPAIPAPAASQPHRNVTSLLPWAPQCDIAVPQAGGRAHHGHHPPRTPGAHATRATSMRHRCRCVEAEDDGVVTGWLWDRSDP